MKLCPTLADQGSKIFLEGGDLWEGREGRKGGRGVRETVVGFLKKAQG